MFFYLYSLLFMKYATWKVVTTKTNGRCVTAPASCENGTIDVSNAPRHTKGHETELQ